MTRDPLLVTDRFYVEDIENLIVSWAEAIKWINTGEIQDAKTIVGLLLYARHYLGDA